MSNVADNNQEEKEGKKKRISLGISHEKCEFLTCIILHMLAPLLPLILEAWFTRGNVTENTLAITASMYAVSIGLSSRNKAIFSFCFFASILFSMAFGILTNGSANSNQQSAGITLPWVPVMAYGAIVFVFLIHVIERYNKHVVECMPFWNFNEVGENNNEGAG